MVVRGSKTPFMYAMKDGSLVDVDVLEQYAVKSEDTKQLPEDPWAGKDQKYPSYVKAPLYNPYALAQLPELNVYHNRCVRTKANDTVGKGYTLNPVVNEPSEDNRKILEEFLNKTVTDTFSGTRTVMGELYKCEINYEGIGYAAYEIIRTGNTTQGQPESIKNIPAQTLRRCNDGVRFVQRRGGETRYFKAFGYDQDVNLETGEIVPLNSLPGERQANDIIYWMDYTPRSDYYGLPDITPAIPTIYGDLSREKYNIAFFRNYGVPAYAIFITGDFEDEEILDDHGNPTGQTVMKKAIQDHFNTIARNPHAPMAIVVPTAGNPDADVKVEFQALSVETKEASFRLYRTDNRDEVIAAHAVPPYRIGIAETGSLGGSTARESTEIYKTSVIKPRQSRVEELFNYAIVQEGFGIKDWIFKLVEIDTKDLMQDLDLVKGMFLMGAVTPNQIISVFGDRWGLETVDHPAMNAHYINNMPIDVEIPENQTAEVMKALKTLRSNLLEVADRYEEKPVPGDGHEGGRLHRAVKQFKI